MLVHASSQPRQTISPWKAPALRLLGSPPGRASIRRRGPDPWSNRRSSNRGRIFGGGSLPPRRNAPLLKPRRSLSRLVSNNPRNHRRRQPIPVGKFRRQGHCRPRPLEARSAGNPYLDNSGGDSATAYRSPTNRAAPHLAVSCFRVAQGGGGCKKVTHPGAAGNVRAVHETAPQIAWKVRVKKSKAL